MKKIIAALAFSFVGVTGAHADGHEYTLEVTANGIDYLCKPEIEVQDGVRIRRCVRAGAGGAVAAGGAGLFAAAGLGSAATVGLAVVSLAVVASAIDNEEESANGTGG